MDGDNVRIILNLGNARFPFKLHCYFLEDGGLYEIEDDAASESTRLDVDPCATENETI
jgi:hypothetical protein